MIELPEAVVLARQIDSTLTGKKIKKVVAAHTPHKFAWFTGDPQKYNDLLKGKTIDRAASRGGLVEIKAGDVSVCLGDGANLRYFRKDEKLPDKHQLWLEFEDGSSLIGTVQMYAGFYVYPSGVQIDSKYYLVAGEKPSPLSAAFNLDYFERLFGNESGKLSLKAFLATDQRIPGLGNGVLQDILFNSEMHPRKKVNTLSEMNKKDLFSSIKTILEDMVEKGGRDTEKDLFGNPGKYQTILSKNTVQKPCPVCGSEIRKEAYLGGSIYFCPSCQKV
jgi:formamidopyrimidine-DNA glycosylase